MTFHGFRGFDHRIKFRVSCPEIQFSQGVSSKNRIIHPIKIPENSISGDMISRFSGSLFSINVRSLSAYRSDFGDFLTIGTVSFSEFHSFSVRNAEPGQQPCSRPSLHEIYRMLSVHSRGIPQFPSSMREKCHSRQV